MKSGIDEISEKISDLVKNIRKENLELNRVNSDNSDTIKDFQQTVENQRQAIKDAVAEAEKLEIPAPKYKYKN